MLQKQLAFTLDSRNKQVILDSYQSEIFCYTMNPGYYPRFFTFFSDRDFISVPKNAKKKKKLGQYPAILTERLVNNAYEYISSRPIQIWQRKTVQKMHFRARNLSDV